LETSKIDFGCILNNTEVFHEIKMTNISPLIVNYKWKFILEKDNVLSNLVNINTPHELTSNLTINLENDHLLSNIIGDPMVETTINSEIENNEKLEMEKEIHYENHKSINIDQNSIHNNRMNELLKSNKLDELMSKASVIELPNIEEIFDISPLYGFLHPGEAQKLKITYYGHKEIKAYVKAICEVKNGPSYDLLIKGEASVLNYEISNHLINFDYIVSILNFIFI
jgi:hydrocephalus-inducing protein